jgi:ubiquinone/menaquinone biosynthesis C-methylase UbiE
MVKGLSLPSGSVDGVYASHVLEHLALCDMREALKETHRILKPGGIFRLIVPDLVHRIRYYMERDPADREAAHTFMRACGFGWEPPRRSLLQRLKYMSANSSHLWMFDRESMGLELEHAGFDRLRQATFGDCEDAMFSYVERSGRFEYGPDPELAIEVRKPHWA